LYVCEYREGHVWDWSSLRANWVEENYELLGIEVGSEFSLEPSEVLVQMLDLL
jgi:hypothetical protein